MISVVLCTYNGGRFLADQLDSLLAQTYRNLEIVAVDDCSLDDSPAILRRYADRDPRIRISFNPVNLGFAKNFAHALRQSRGELVAPCDQDDIWLPEKLAALAAAIDGRSMAFCDSSLIDERGRPLGYCMSQLVSARSIDDPAPFAFGNCVSGHAMVFRRELLAHALPIPPAFFYDWWLAAVAASMQGIVYCDQPLVLYRQHGGTVTHQRVGEMIDEAGLDRSRDAELPQIPEKRLPHPHGHKLRYVRDTEQRLAALARLPGPHQAFLMELRRLWGDRESQWISWRLWRLLVDHRSRLLALTKMSSDRQSRYCAEFFWGLRAKRLTSPRAYAAG